MPDLNIDALAAEIRRVDGNHDLGAGALAEALLPFIQQANSAFSLNASRYEFLRKIPALEDDLMDRVVLVMERKAIELAPEEREGPPTMEEFDQCVDAGMAYLQSQTSQS